MSKETLRSLPYRLNVHQLPPEIKALPTDWVPNEKPSKVVEKLIHEKQTLHNNCVSKLRDKMFKIKLEIDDEIKQVSNVVKDCIKRTKKSCEELLQKYTFDFNKSNANEKRPEDVYKMVGCKITDMCDAMRVEVSALNSKLKSIETKRMARLKTLLAETRAELNAICYRLPHDVQLFVEAEQMALNQITLSNQYAYSELQARLTAIAASSQTFYVQHVERLQAQYAASYERRERQLRESKGDDSWTVESLRAFAEGITAQIFHINSECTAAIGLIYRVLDKIQEGKYDEVQQIEPNFVGVPKREFLSIHDEVYSSLWEEDAWELVTAYTNVMANRWTKVVDVMALEVEFCKKATVDGLHIWDKHFVRQAEASDIFGLDLWDFVNKNDDVDDMRFVDLHKAVDVLRSSPTEEDLNVAMGECKKIIDAIIKSNEKNCEKQAKFFDKFRDMMIRESEILYLEMSLFVKCMPSDDDVNPTIFRGRRSRIKIVPPEDKPLLMKEFDAEIKAMHNWLYGVNQHLKKGADQCTEKAISYANKWIDRNFIIVYVHHTIKVSILDDMYQQIFHHVYRVRLAELIGHQQRLGQHLAGLDVELKKLTTPNVYAEQVNLFKQKVDKLSSSLKMSKNSKTTTSLADQLQVFKRSCLKDLAAQKDSVQEMNNNRLQELLAVNVDYIKSLKYFGEGGNYSIEEAAEMKKYFTKANKDVQQNKAVMLKENDEAFDAAVEELGEIEKAMTAASAEINKQFEFEEFLDDHLAEVRRALHKETQDLLDESATLSNHVAHLKELAERYVGKIQYLDDFASNCAYMEMVFQGLHRRVYQIEPFNLNASFFKESNAKDVKGKDDVKKAEIILEKLQEKLVEKDKKVDKLAGNREEEKEDGALVERVKRDCFKLVFSKVPSGEDYMAKIVKILFQSMEELQDRAQAIIKEEHLRLRWYVRNELEIRKSAEKDTAGISDAENQQLNDYKATMVESEGRKYRLKGNDAPPEMDDSDEPDVGSEAHEEKYVSTSTIMHPLLKTDNELIYTKGRTQYLKKRAETLPELRYYFKETSGFEYGWRMWDCAKTMEMKRHGKSAIIKQTFYRRRAGIESDPEWYKSPKYYESNMLDESDEETLNYENNLKSFMIDHLAKYLYYQLQCDEILLEVTLNYILELDELLSFMTDYYKRSMDAFIVDKLAQLRENCANHKNRIAEIAESISAQYKLAMARLKPLHGHPKNKNLLDDIQLTLTQLEDAAYEQQAQLDKLCAQREAEVEDNLNIFETQVEKMENELKACAGNFITMYIQDAHIFNQLKCKLKYFDQIMADDTIGSTSTVTIDAEVVEKLNSKLKSLKLGLKVSDTEFSSIIESKWMQASSIKEKYSSGDYLTMSSVSSLDFYLIMENFRDEQGECLRELKSSKGVTNVVNLWAKVWRGNVDEINRLYTVKYVPVEKVENASQKRPTKEQKREKKK